MRRLPAGAARLATPSGRRPGDRSGIQFGLLHDVEDVEHMAAAERVGGRRASVNRHQVGLLRPRHTERRQVAVAPAAAPSATARPAARVVVIRRRCGGRFGDRRRPGVKMGLGGHLLERQIRSGGTTRGNPTGGGKTPGRGLAVRGAAVILAATPPAAATAAATAFGLAAFLGIFDGAGGHRGVGVLIGLGTASSSSSAIDRFRTTASAIGGMHHAPSAARPA